MLKRRLIPVLFLKNGYLVRSERFTVHQNLGSPALQVERYNAWDVDELVYIDITPDDSYDMGRDDLGVVKNPKSILDVLSMVAAKSFMPLTFGGKIRTLEQIRTLLSLGADKVTINAKALEEPEFITAAAETFGSQAIVVSIDALRSVDGGTEVYGRGGTWATGRVPEEWALEAQDRGAGEILLNSIDRDGMATGYDLPLLDAVASATTIPVIACGGVGKYADFAAALNETGVSAVAAGNIFHFKEMSYILAKRELRKAGIDCR